MFFAMYNAAIVSANLRIPEYDLVTDNLSECNTFSSDLCNMFSSDFSGAAEEDRLLHTAVRELHSSVLLVPASNSHTNFLVGYSITICSKLY